MTRTPTRPPARLSAVAFGLIALALLPPRARAGEVVHLPDKEEADLGAGLDPAPAALDRSTPRKSWASLLVLGTVSAYLLASASTLALPPVELAREQEILRDALRWVRTKAALALLAGNAAYYGAHAIYDAFFSLHLRRLGFGDLFVGGAWATGVLVEIAVMFAAPARLGGGERRSGALLCGATAAACLRWSLLSWLEAPGPLLAQQALHGITFGLWYLSLVQQIQATAPERLRTTLQSFAAASIGLGATAGYQLGGRLFAAGGGAACFRLALGAAGLALLCYLASYLLTRRGAPRSSRDCEPPRRPPAGS